MSITPESSDQSARGKSKHGSLLSGNLCPSRVNSQWKSTAIAQLVLWIGYLQWHFRVNGADRAPPEPILRDVRTIQNRDALVAWDARVPEVDADGQPVTRWDGEAMRPHPVTGRPIPDETARVPVYRYEGVRAAVWPRADFIIGNPPFIGGKDVRERLGDGYFEALFATTDVPESADFVMHWWDRAASAVRSGATRRFGFVTTNSITQVFSRRVITKHLDAKDRLSLIFAIPNHPWVDEKDGAAVRIAMTVAASGKLAGQHWTVVDERGAPDHITFTERAGQIGSDLRIGADVTAAVALKANHGLCSPGVKLHGDGFILTAAEVEKISPNSLKILDYIAVSALYNSQQPAASSQQPAASSQQPAASSQQPAASSQQPAASSQQPAASSQQPAASSQQPAALDPQRNIGRGRSRIRLSQRPRSRGAATRRVHHRSVRPIRSASAGAPSRYLSAPYQCRSPAT
ncbi:DNA methyltransferase [Sphingobium sp. AntQ-1]|uniref:DNA methyltransferase n=1 Tax=Sphingobium sp. AntQ-1 TaxID=2930091 RepID=UPI00234F36AC|nr:DNA methyltransferase [Sphingobium sp. AntQ-1]